MLYGVVDLRVGQRLLRWLRVKEQLRAHRQCFLRRLQGCDFHS